MPRRRLPLIAAFVLAVVLAVVLIASGNRLGWALLVIDLALLMWNIRLDRREARLRRSESGSSPTSSTTYEPKVSEPTPLELGVQPRCHSGSR